MLQIAVSLVLVVGAGLFVRTLDNAYSVDVGYEVDGVLVLPLNLEPRGYFEGGARGAEAGLAVYERILSRLEANLGGEDDRAEWRRAIDCCQHRWTSDRA